MESAASKTSSLELMEVDITGEMSHPGQPEEHYLYIAMELCEGGTLKKWMKENPKSNDEDKYNAKFYEERTAIFQHICSGVQYIHKEGFIHRDLKPANIYFTQSKLVKIGDFGLATNMGQEQTRGAGTPWYMAPEQWNSTDYTNKADIYSLGLIWLELLVPFGTQECGP